MAKDNNIIGSYAPDFELPGIDDKVYHLFQSLQSHQGIGVIFMGNECPYVRLYLDRLKQIQADFQDRGFTLIGINANDPNQYPEDSFEKMKALAEQMKLNFPYLWDSTQDVAHSFGAEKTPEVFLLDQKGILRYTGAVDDNVQEAEAVREHYLRDAISAVLNGETVATPVTEAVGCSLKWAK